MQVGIHIFKCPHLIGFTVLCMSHFNWYLAAPRNTFVIGMHTETSQYKKPVKA